MSYLAYLRLLFKHADDVATLVALVPDAKSVINGPGWVADRKEPLGRIIDVSFPIADEIEETIRNMQVMSADQQRAEEAKLVNNAVTLGISPSDLLQLVQLIAAVIEFIRSLSKNNVSADSVEVS